MIDPETHPYALMLMEFCGEIPIYISSESRESTYGHCFLMYVRSLESCFGAVRQERQDHNNPQEEARYITHSDSRQSEF